MIRNSTLVGIQDPAYGLPFFNEKAFSRGKCVIELTPSNEGSGHNSGDTTAFSRGKMCRQMEP